MNVDDLPSQSVIIPRKLNLMSTVFVGGYADDLSVFENSVRSQFDLSDHF